MIYSSAAHPPCLIWRPTKFKTVKNGKTQERSITELNVYASDLGLERNKHYQVQQYELQKNDVILWYTDGLTENLNEKNQMFGTRNLKKIMRSSEGLSANEIRDRIMEAAFQHYGKIIPADDITFIVSRVK